MSEAPMIDEPFFIETESGKLIAYDFNSSEECVELEIFGRDMNPQYFMTVENIQHENSVVKFDIAFERKGHPDKRFVAGTVMMTRHNYEANELSHGFLPTHVACSSDGGTMSFCAFKLHGLWYSMNGFMQDFDAEPMLFGSEVL